MADGQPSALGTGCHPGSETYVGLPGQQKNCMCGAATCDLNHIMTSYTHFGERPSVDDIAEMNSGYMPWLRAIADTTWWWPSSNQVKTRTATKWFDIYNLNLQYKTLTSHERILTLLCCYLCVNLTIPSIRTYVQSLCRTRTLSSDCCACLSLCTRRCVRPSPASLRSFRMLTWYLVVNPVSPWISVPATIHSLSHRQLQ